MYRIYLTAISLIISSFSICQVIVTTVTNEFPGSGGVKFGPDGNIYIGNYGDGLQNSNGTQIWKYTISNGDLTQFATGLSGASGNAFDSQGNLFQSNIGNSSISKVTPTGNVSFFSSTGITAPVGITIDENDNLYVCNCGDNTIQKITPSGVSTLFSSGLLFSCPNGITQDQEGNFYVTNFNGSNNLIKILPDGTPSVFVNIPGGNNGHLDYDATDTSLIVASHGASRIYRVNLSSGQRSTIAGSGVRGNDDGIPEEASFSRPNGVAVSATGDSIYINSSVPTSNVNLPLNPSLLRLITGVRGLTSSIGEPFVSTFDKFSAHYSPNIISIKFVAKKVTDVQISIHSLEGKLLSTVLKNNLSNREHLIQIPQNLTNGMYIATLSTKEQLISYIFNANH